MKHEILKSKLLLNGFLNVKNLEINVKYDDGHEQTINRFLVEGKNAVSVFVYDFKNNLALMVEQFRVGMVYDDSALSLECPAGLIDEGETPMQAVIRELREETGLIVSENMISQVSDNTYFSCGMMTHKISVFTCECDLSNVKEGIYSHDKDEYIKTRLVSYDSLREKLHNKQIKHITQVAAIQHSIIAHLPSF